jgi:hypothetical protein
MLAKVLGAFPIPICKGLGFRYAPPAHGMNKIVGSVHAFHGLRQRIRFKQVCICDFRLLFQGPLDNKFFRYAHQASNPKAFLIESVQKAATDKSSRASQKNPRVTGVHTLSPHLPELTAGGLLIKVGGGKKIFPRAYLYYDSFLPANLVFVSPAKRCPPYSHRIILREMAFITPCFDARPSRRAWKDLFGKTKPRPHENLAGLFIAHCFSN